MSFAICSASSSLPIILLKFLAILSTESAVVYIDCLNFGSPIRAFIFAESLLKSAVACSIRAISWSISLLESSRSLFTFSTVEFALNVKSFIWLTVSLSSAIVWSESRVLIFWFVSVRDSAALYCQSIKSAILIGSIIVYFDFCCGYGRTVLSRVEILNFFTLSLQLTASPFIKSGSISPGRFTI